jgi:hypothetical protein
MLISFLELWDTPMRKGLKYKLCDYYGVFLAVDSTTSSFKLSTDLLIGVSFS